MNEVGISDVLEPAIAAALESKGFTALTPVQHAVLAPNAAGRDLRITSQTGSGKTVALGLVIRDLVVREPVVREPGVKPVLGKSPRALVIAPTRELARQVEEELAWLYAAIGVKVASLTGGASYRDEFRALMQRPEVIVGTPGRLLDHLERGSLDLLDLQAIVLDEADRMLDLGFREALEAIFAKAPEARRTHLVSATFPPDVKWLADRVQRDPVHIEGTRLGAANVDIEHIIHLVDHDQRFDAIVNLLLAHSDARTLIFARTRADVAQIADRLSEVGFGIAALSGEMQQQQRTRALSAFKRGNLRALVATDVAARGLDVNDVTLVIHVEPPTDSDSYTHRSGRTGRAGKKGTSALLVAPRELAGARRVLSRAGVRFRTELLPTAESIRSGEDERIIRQLADEDGVVIDPRTAALAKRLVEAGDLERTVARLLAKSFHADGPEARDVRAITPQDARPRRAPVDRGDYRDQRPDHRSDYRPDMRPDYRPDMRPDMRGARPDMRQADVRAGAPEQPRALRGTESDRGWVPFHITWGERQGADPRRLLAMVCRRGGIGSSEVGGIRVGPTSSEVQISESVAASFAEAARRPDPRDRGVTIRPDSMRPEQMRTETRPEADHSEPRPEPMRTETARTEIRSDSGMRPGSGGMRPEGGVHHGGMRSEHGGGMRPRSAGPYRASY